MWEKERERTKEKRNSVSIECIESNVWYLANRKKGGISPISPFARVFPCFSQRISEPVRAGIRLDIDSSVREHETEGTPEDKEEKREAKAKTKLRPGNYIAFAA
jgi:hypothetical protein